MLEVLFLEKINDRIGSYFTYLEIENGVLLRTEYNGNILDTFKIMYKDVPSNTKLAIHINDQGKFMDIIDVDKLNSNRYSSRSIYSSSFKDFKNEADVSASDVTFFKSTNGDFILFFMGILCSEDSSSDKISQSFSSLLVSRYPDYLEKRKAIYIKRDFTSTLDSNDTLAYLEVQVDFLTYVLCKLVDNHPEIVCELNNDVSFYSFRKYLDESSIMKIKPIENCIEEITNKVRLRKRQERYYENKFSNGLL